MSDARMFPPGTPVSPSGWCTASACGRRVDRIVTTVGVDGHVRHKGSCWWCAKPVPKPRREWCSDACGKQMMDRDPSTIRSRALTRDRDKPCALCGDTRGGHEVDHTIPIVEGGHPWDLANLRSICRRCHVFESRCLASRRAAARRVGTTKWQPCERRPENAGRPQCRASLFGTYRDCVCEAPPKRKRPKAPELFPVMPPHPSFLTSRLRDWVLAAVWWERRRRTERAEPVAPS